MKKTLYFNASAGVSGDMFVGALIDLGASLELIAAHVGALGVDGIRLEAESVTRRGIAGTKFRVIDPPSGLDVDDPELVSMQPHPHHHQHPHAQAHVHDHPHGQSHDHSHDHGHGHSHPHPHAVKHTHSHGPRRGWHHRGFTEIKALIENAELPEAVARDAIGVFKLLGEAEAKVHGSTLENVHFHEVGALDSIADIVGAVSALHQIDPDVVLCSPIHVGCGTIRCAHGTLSVPAPATMELLEGVPAYSDRIEGELATPTGVALMKYFCQDFCVLPPMRIMKSGYGAGTKDFGIPGVLRATLGVSLGQPLHEAATDTLHTATA